MMMTNVICWLMNSENDKNIQCYQLKTDMNKYYWTKTNVHNRLCYQYEQNTMKI